MSEYSQMLGIVMNGDDEDLPDDFDPDEEMPDDDIDDSLKCKYPGCSNALVYSGRGRRPQFCPEHKAGGKKVTPESLANKSRIKGTNEQLAAQAAAVLAKSNSLASLALLAFGMPLTATAIAEHNQQFEQNAYEALLLDPALCKKILSTGGKTAGVALFLAYGQLGMAFIPLAMREVKEKRADALEKKEKENAAGI